MSTSKKKNQRTLKPRIKTALSERICKHINENHGGSVLAAANALDIPYDSLRFQALGTAVRPNVVVAQKLALATGKPVDWWLA